MTCFMELTEYTSVSKPNGNASNGTGNALGKEPSKVSNKMVMILVMALADSSPKSNNAQSLTSKCNKSLMNP